MPILRLFSMTLLRPPTSAMDHSVFELKFHPKLRTLYSKNSFVASAATHSVPKHLAGCSLHLELVSSSKIWHSPLIEESSRGEPACSKVSIVKCGGHILHDLEEDLMNKCTSDSEFSRNAVAVCNKELERRRKIGVANKGKTPWNKGRTHSKETIELIKKRTIEALKDPKVRKKMSEWPHSHSEQSKARISLALKKFWLERLKHKQLVEKLYVGYIAEAAKKGGDDQIELDWDSFQKIKADLNCKYLQEREEKAKARQAKKLSKCLQDIVEKAKARKAKILRTEKAAMSMVENSAQQMQKKEEQAIPKAFAQENMLNKQRNNASARVSKVMEGLAKIHVIQQRRSSLESHPVVEKLDLEAIKMEKRQRRPSLADQLQLLKNNKLVVPEE